MIDRERICVAVADSARARLFTYGSSERGYLEEMADLVNPLQRARDGEVFSTTKPGVKRSPTGVQHGADDHRDHHRKKQDRTFAAAIVDRAAELCARIGCDRVVLVASPGMLAPLRHAIAHGPPSLRDVQVQEVNRDLGYLSVPQVHDWLADAHVVPPRHRVA